MRTVLLCALILLVACSESFPPASAVTDFRVVASKVEVEAEPSRANPSPGEPVQVSILSIDQGAPPSDFPEVPALTPALLQWAFAACIPLPVTIGPPLCSDLIEPCEGCLGAPPADVFATPVMRFQAPSEAELEQAGASTVLLQGVVCSNGTPSPDAIRRFLSGETDELVLCEGPTMEGQPAEGRFVVISIPIEDDPANPNLNPALQNILLDGASWPPPYDQGVPRTAPRTGCAADLDGLSEQDKMAHPRAGSPPSTIDLSVTPDSLQTYMRGEMELTEEIQVSWLADGGGFQTTFSFITDPARSILTQWQAFDEVPDEGVLVRFNFVIRDGRGGSDWLERGICILPATAP